MTFNDKIMPTVGKEQNAPNLLAPTPNLAVGVNPAKPKTSEELVKRDPLTQNDFKSIIRDMGLKVTQQRMTILKALSEGRAHVTAQEVFEAVHEEYEDIGFATVYRFLRKLTETSYVTEVRMGGLPARYELTPRNHHDHITCVQCSRIVEFESPQIEQLQIDIAQKHGFELTGHVLELYGRCQFCNTAD